MGSLPLQTSMVGRMTELGGCLQHAHTPVKKHTHTHALAVTNICMGWPETNDDVVCLSVFASCCWPDQESSSGVGTSCENTSGTRQPWLFSSCTSILLQD